MRCQMTWPNSTVCLVTGNLFIYTKCCKRVSNLFCFILLNSLNKDGLGRALVMKYAVEEINANSQLLPGVKLGYKIYNTCRHSAVIVRPALSFLTEKSNGTLSVECNYTDYETDMVAVIGPQSSEMVTVIGKLLGFFLMPQVWTLLKLQVIKLCLMVQKIQ